MGFADQYLEKQNDFKSFISTRPLSNLNYVVVIPCYNEDKLVHTLKSLYDCRRPSSPVEIIIVINSSADADDKVKQQNLKTCNEAGEWISTHSAKHFSYHIIFVPGLPPRFAGAGMARKIGMDEAVARFNMVKNRNGLILSLDADSKCDNNYFSEIESLFIKYNDAVGCTLYFEHPLSGDEFPESVYKAITLYELNLRYFVQALRLTSFPYAYHTVGSCFAVKATTYASQGGMNRRRAGEDFYFLHKIIPLGNFFELNSTRVIPSPRPSARVPFGTGPVINRFIAAKDSELMTYNNKAFDDLSMLFKIFPALFKKHKSETAREINKLPETLQVFLNNNNAIFKIDEANNNSSSVNSFTRRLYSWFNAFKTIKYLNFCSERYYPKINVIDAANILADKLSLTDNGRQNEVALLELLRRYERSHPCSLSRELQNIRQEG